MGVTVRRTSTTFSSNASFETRSTKNRYRFNVLAPKRLLGQAEVAHNNLPRSLLMLIEIFCVFDDFCILFDNVSANSSLPGPVRHPGGRPADLCPSEIMTILAYFHVSHDRNFKRFYLDCVMNRFRCEFPSLVSHSRFVTLQSIVVSYLAAYLLTCGLGTCTGISFC